MRHLKGENMADLRKKNRAKILEMLLKNAPISRAEMSEVSGLTPPTITALVNEFLQEGLLEEVGAERSSRTIGRKRIALRLIADSKLAIGLEIGVRQLLVGVTNLNGELLHKTSAPLRAKDPESVLRLAVDRVKEVLRGFPREKIIGLGVGATGMVDSEAGVVRHSPNLGWRDMPLRGLLERELLLPVVLDNNVRLMALGENLFSRKRDGASRMILVHVGYGIGCGIILNGDLYYGRAFGAGELGHTTILPGGPECSCGKKGCLEAVASGRAMAVRFARQVGIQAQAYRTVSARLLGAAKRGDEQALDILREAGGYLGVSLGNLVSLLAPDLIVLHGVFFDIVAYTQEMIRLARETSFGNNGDIPIEHSRRQEELVILGAGALAIRRLIIDRETRAEKPG